MSKLVQTIFKSHQNSPFTSDFQSQFSHSQSNYRPQSQQSNTSSQRKFKKQFKNYSEEEDHINYLNSLKPKSKRTIYKVTSGGNCNDNFVQDNKTVYYKPQKSCTNNFFQEQNDINQKQKQLQNKIYKTRQKEQDDKRGNFKKMSNYRIYNTLGDNISNKHSQSVQLGQNDRKIDYGYETTGLFPQRKVQYKAEKDNNIQQNPYQQQRQQKILNNKQYSDKNHDQNETEEYYQQSQQKNQKTDNQQGEDYQDPQENEEIYDKNDKCYVPEPIDPSWLENITFEELSQVFPEDLLFNNNIDFPKLLEEQPDYFLHLFGQCACVKCTCGLCKCDARNVKLKLLSSYQTTYGKDFFKSPQRKLLQKQQSFDLNRYSTKFGGFNQLQSGYQSMYRNDFKQHPVEKQTKYKQEYQKDTRPQMLKSNYSTNFVDWKSYHIDHIKSNNHKSTDSRIPLMGQTNYRDNFGKCPDSKNLILDNDLKKQRKAPFTLSQPFQKETTSQSFFKPFQHKPEYIKAQQQRYDPVPSYEGQFRTTFNKDFKGHQDKKCPINSYKKVFRIKIQEKLEQLKNKKQTIDFQKQNSQFNRQELIKATN